MKSLSLVKIAVCCLICEALLAALVYFFALPAASSATVDRLTIAVIVFLAGIIGLVAMFPLACRFRIGKSYATELANAIKLPLFLIDGDSRYLKFNSEAEARFGLNREKDIGKDILPEISGALAASRYGDATEAKRFPVRIDESYYMVAESAYGDANGADSARQRLIVLGDVTDKVRVQRFVKEINQTMALLDGNSVKISSSSASLSQGATEQASSLAAISSSLDEFSKKVQGNTDTAVKGTQLAAQAREVAERSGNEITNALSAMSDVQEAGVRVARIVKLIDDIAFQTNLLALNAAVEAARAGRQGKGFAVVADEVRNLAGRSAKAAKDTASMMEDVTERIGNATAYISRLGDMLKNIVQDAIRMADSSASASAISAEQANGIMHVNKELGQMNSLTLSTMSAAEQAATGVEVMVRQVRMLKEQLENLSINVSVNGKTSVAAPGEERQGVSINLLDDPDALSPGVARGRYLSRDDSGRGNDEASEYGGSHDNRKTDAVGWDLSPEAFRNEPSLGKLLESDGYYNGINPYVTDSTDGKGGETGGKRDPFDMKFGKNAFVAKNTDRDRVVNPNQNIVLDDSEFGRY